MTVEERVSASAHVASRVELLLSERLAAGAVVALYAAKGSEVETALIDVAARRAGLRVVYPRVVEDERELAFHEVMRDELVTSRFALQEPRADTPGVALAEIAAFVVPGLGFDRTGGRVGWGRGHYDATLQACPQALRIGLAFECQLVDRIPREDHDAPVHVIVTEAAAYVA
jgi:5-formyltetrahydrofolate cyclo-ligase